MPVLPVMPSRLPLSIGRNSRLIFNWRARDLFLAPLLSGQGWTTVAPQFATLADTTTKTPAGVDSLGKLIRRIAAPNWRMRDENGDGEFEEPYLIIQRNYTNPWSLTEDISNAVWTKTRCAPSGAVAMLAPDGKFTAFKLIEDATATQTHFLSRALAAAPADNTP